jgi:hypothetical protein
MAATLVALTPDYTRRRKRNRIKITPTGNYAAGGQVIDLTALTNPNFLPNVGISGFNIPALSDVAITKVPAGYTAEMVAGTNTAALATAFKLKIFTAPDTELAAGAYPASLLADYFEIEVNVNSWTQ